MDWERVFVGVMSTAVVLIVTTLALAFSAVVVVSAYRFVTGETCQQDGGFK